MKTERWDSVFHFNATSFVDIWMNERGRMFFGVPQVKFQQRRSGKYKRRYFRVNDHILMNVDVHKNCRVTLGLILPMLQRYYTVRCLVEFVDEETYVKDAR